MAGEMDDALREVCQVQRPIINILADDLPQRLKASLWFSIGKIVDEESLRLNMNATPQFIGAVTEMVWEQIGSYITPLYPSHLLPVATANITQQMSQQTSNPSHAMQAERQSQRMMSYLLRDEMMLCTIL